MTDNEAQAFEHLRELAERQALRLVKNRDGSYSLMSVGDIPRTIAGVTTLEQVYDYLTDPDRFKP